MQKNVTKSEKKITNSIKLDLPSCPLIPLIFIKRYTKSIIFVTFCIKKKLAIPVFICEQTFWWFTEDVYKILRYKIWKYVLENCPFTPNIFLKRYTWSIYFKTIHWKLNISWTYSEINLKSSHNPKNSLPRLFKRVHNKLF